MHNWIEVLMVTNFVNYNLLLSVTIYDNDYDCTEKNLFNTGTCSHCINCCNGYHIVLECICE